MQKRRSARNKREREKERSLPWMLRGATLHHSSRRRRRHHLHCQSHSPLRHVHDWYSLMSRSDKSKRTNDRQWNRTNEISLPDVECVVDGDAVVAAAASMDIVAFDPKQRERFVILVEQEWQRKK